MDASRLSLLDEPLIRIRDINGRPQKVSLPELFVALGLDAVHDYPALRPHQRHPWHAVTVQLAALALNKIDATPRCDDVDAWRQALLALTPGHPDGSAYCLVSVPQRPAFLQPPAPDDRLDDWKAINTPDALDMLVTSKNHDLKSERMRNGRADDWLFALTSLQTQEGFLGAGNYGISRMNGGFSSRPALGAVPLGGIGKRWQRDVAALTDAREELLQTFGFSEEGTALLWVTPWDGTTSVAFNMLDPFYIEICRRIRLGCDGRGNLNARATGTKAARIDAAIRKGITGDAWMPVEEDKALTLAASGFNYGLASELAWGTKYRKTIAQRIRPEDGDVGVRLVAQGVVRGQGKTEGYHERRIPLSKKAIGLLRSRQTDSPSRIASERVQAIAIIRGSVLRTALFALFETGADRIDFERRTAKQQAEPFLRTFERIEDVRFFDDLNREIDADDEQARSDERLSWLAGLAKRAEATLYEAFARGPQCGERRYRARSQALAFFHGLLRKHFPELSEHLNNHRKREELA